MKKQKKIFERHRELLSSDQCSEYEKSYFNAILEDKAGTTELMTSLQLLSQMLDEHYNVAPIIIIDEYDTPIQQGHSKGFYDDVILFIVNKKSSAETKKEERNHVRI